MSSMLSADQSSHSQKLYQKYRQLRSGKIIRAVCNTQYAGCITQVTPLNNSTHLVGKDINGSVEMIINTETTLVTTA